MEKSGKGDRAQLAVAFGVLLELPGRDRRELSLSPRASWVVTA